MQNTKKLLYSLYAVGTILGASLLSGCQTTRYVYLAPDGTPAYTPTITSGSNIGNSHVPSSILSGVLQGIGQGLSGL